MIRKLSSYIRKNILVFRIANQYYIHPRPVPPKGAARDRHERGAGCDGRGWCRGRTAQEADGQVVWSWHLKGWCQAGGGNSSSDGVNKARSPGRLRSNRKPLRAERRVFWCICGDYPGLAFFFCPASRGCIVRPAFPRPDPRAKPKMIPRAKKITRRDREVVSCRHCEEQRDEAIHFALPLDGLLR